MKGPCKEGAGTFHSSSPCLKSVSEVLHYKRQGGASRPPFSVSWCHCVFSSAQVIHLVSWTRSFQEVALHYFHGLPMSDIKTPDEDNL